MRKKNNLKINILLIFIGLLMLFFAFSGRGTFADREFANNWYIRNFDTTITLNKNSSSNIVERITADCRTAIGKHGIIRILPEETKVKDKGIIKTPVKLVDITDFSGKPYKYKIIRKSHTIAWEIGDPNKTVQGVHNYLIHYKVGNVIRFNNPSFDEFYWNILGTFWDLDIDNFHAKIIFPKEISKNNTKLEFYSGYFGSKGKGLTTHSWTSSNILEFSSIQPLKKRQGITISVVFPKHIFVPYHFTFYDIWESYRNYFYLIIPLITFLFCFSVWRKYGRDPRLEKSIMPIYKPPQDLTPLEIGMLQSGGTFKNAFITAEIINLAVKRLITIKEVKTTELLLFNSKDYLLIKNTNNLEINKILNPLQKFIFEKIFADSNEIKLSSLKTKGFYKYVRDIKNKAKNDLIEKDLMTKKGFGFRSFLTVLSTLFLLPLLIVKSFLLLTALAISSAIFFVFSLLMTRRTPKGAEINWKIEGFKLFMKTVDKDRAKFYEKQNIFEEFLPYAIVFNITDLWIRRMKDIYGEDYFTHYTPAWYTGTNTAFDFGSFTSSINDLTSAIGRSVSSSSGANNSGNTGSGFGGGGGSGW